MCNCAKESFLTNCREFRRALPDRDNEQLMDSPRQGNIERGRGIQRERERRGPPAGSNNKQLVIVGVCATFGRLGFGLRFGWGIAKAATKMASSRWRPANTHSRQTGSDRSWSGRRRRRRSGRRSLSHQAHNLHVELVSLETESCDDSRVKHISIEEEEYKDRGGGKGSQQ